MKRTLILFTMLLAGCLAPPAARISPIPTEMLPTVIAQTLMAQGFDVSGDEPAPSATPAPTSTAGAPTPQATRTPEAVPGEEIPTLTPSLTRTASATPTPTPGPAIPPAEIEITAPGALSRVTSPFPLRALLVPGYEGRATVELLGEDGRVITRQIVTLNPDLGRKAGLVLDIAFEIPAEAELGRLVISRQDEFGRTTALSSIELILLASGDPDLNVVVDRLARFIIAAPENGALIQGGRIVVSGLARPAVPQGLVAEIITEKGAIIGQRVFNVLPGAPGEYVPFVVEIPYTVSEPTWVLLIVRERGERIPGITYLNSTEILLSP
jgi:hypothetical protein